MPNPVLGDRYEIQKQLGKNSGRRTLLARDLQTQGFVVIKLLSFDNETEWDDLKLFEREADTLKNLSHPAIPQYLNSFELNLRNGKGFALIQTYVHGKSLETLLQGGKTLTEAQAKQVAKALLEILVYLHGQQPPVIHRDIKPKNILLTDTSGDRPIQVYLVDFGSVRAATPEENTNFTVVGTYGYMPPEQFSGRAIAASDLYSLGATLITLVTGTHPSSLPRRGSRIDFGQVADLSPAFADWLSWMTESSLERRLTSAQAALQALEQGQTRNAAVAVVAKPADSKVALSKDAKALEIIMPALLGQVRLRIDAQEISLAQKRLGLSKGRPQVGRRQEIRSVTYTKSGDAPRLAIAVGSQQYELGGPQSLTAAELDWLAYELSTWLKIPLAKS
ncbi:serine/threonine protein kinase [Trichocoleus desertorum AS-A10]|uniref:serine/threonine protein kinase n=1 Tax=Trichocoleus desertorum TaxID=1481672 RepID=UPI003296ECBE